MIVMDYIRSFIAWGGSIVYQLPPEDVRDRMGAEVEQVRHGSSTEFCWYLSPEHNFVELILLVPMFMVFLFLVAEHVSFTNPERLPEDPRGKLVQTDTTVNNGDYYYFHHEHHHHDDKDDNEEEQDDNTRRRRRRDTKKTADQPTSPQPPRGKLERRYSLWYIVDVLLCISFLAAYVATVTFKALTGRMLYLLQPCHIANALLLISSIFPGVVVDAETTGTNGDQGPRVRVRRRIWSSIIFAYIVDTWYGSLGALAMPDTRGLVLPGEVFSFFFQHTLLTLVPPYYLLRRRFEVPLRIGNIIANWSFFGLLHFALFLPLSLYLGDNINFIVHPPPGFDVFGWAYRLVCTFGTPLIMLFFRYTIMNFVSGLNGILGINKHGNEITTKLLNRYAQVTKGWGGLTETYTLPYNALLNERKSE